MIGAAHFRVQCFLDADPPLDSGLSSLNLSHDLLDVLQLIASLPEHSCTQTQHISITCFLDTVEQYGGGRRFDIPEYSMTSSGVLPSTSRAMFSMSSLPHFSLALMNWLKSRLVQIVKPWGYKTHWRELLHKHHFLFLESRNIWKHSLVLLIYWDSPAGHHMNSPLRFTCERRFSFSSSSSSLSGSASSILACSSFCIWAELGRSGFLGTC